MQMTRDARVIPGVGPAVLLGLTAWLATAPAAEATTLRRMDLPELVARADRVVHARALDNDVHWNAAGTQILTDTTFEVLDEARGQGPTRLTVTMLGGRIDPVEMFAAGTPMFSPGEEVVLFTSPAPDGRKNLVGFSQGVLRVREEPVTGEKVAVGEVQIGVTFVQMVGGRPAVTPPSRVRAPLGALLDQIRKLSAETDHGPAGGPKHNGLSVRSVPVRHRGQP